MRRLAPLLLLLVCCSCISVDDFGSSWDSGVVDPALDGTWLRVAGVGAIPDSGPERMTFSRNADHYVLLASSPAAPWMTADMLEQRRKDNERPWLTRTLRVGTLLFLMERIDLGKTDGLLIRYEASGSTLRVFFPDNDAAVDLIEKQRPRPSSITRNSGEGRYVVIRTLDREAARVLGEMTAPRYWTLESEYRRAAGGPQNR